jgi:hypothetical protein
LRALADLIASALMVNAFGSCADWLVLVKVGEARDLGGWGHAGASGQVESVLQADPLVAAAPALADALEGALLELETLTERLGPCEHEVGICVCELQGRAAAARAALLAAGRGE